MTEVFVLSYCIKDDKTRNFKVFGVYSSLSIALGHISEVDVFDHAVDSFMINTGVGRRVFRTWAGIDNPCEVEG